jgi:hypothetical protein
VVPTGRFRRAVELLPSAVPGMSALGEKPLHAEFMLTQALSGRHPRDLVARANRPGS